MEEVDSSEQLAADACSASLRARLLLLLCALCLRDILTVVLESGDCDTAE